MIKRKKTKKNPELQKKANSILYGQLDANNISFLSEGNYAEIYKFDIEVPTRISFISNNMVMKPGTYVLKLQKWNNLLDLKGRNFLKKLSKHKLIPEIYVISSDFIIMKYIEGNTLRDLINNEENIAGILHKVGRIVEKYHDLGYSHSDLHSANILIDKNGEVHLIDPKILEKNFEKDENIMQYYYEEYVYNT